MQVDSGECLFEIGHFEQRRQAHGDDVHADQLVVDLEDVVWGGLLVEEWRTGELVDAEGEVDLVEVA